jgi:hypothetical protein
MEGSMERVGFEKQKYPFGVKSVDSGGSLREVKKDKERNPLII